MCGNVGPQLPVVGGQVLDQKVANVLGSGPDAYVGSRLSFELPNQEDHTAHAPGQWVGQCGDAVIDPAGQHSSADELRSQQGVELIGGNDCSERALDRKS